jgi:hypothetical protein
MISTPKQNNRHISRAAALVLCLSLWSCFASAQPRPNKAEYKKIFSDAISNSLSSQKSNNVCLPPMNFGSGGSNSIELNQRIMDASPSAPTGQASQLNALEEAGLVTSVPSERTINNKIESFRGYKRTEKGNRYYSEGRFCYGRAELNRIVKWKGPAIFGEYKIAWVYYTAKTTNIAEWATSPAILAAFPSAKSTLQDDPDKIRQVLIDLSSEGWEVNEWSKVLQ